MTEEELERSIAADPDAAIPDPDWTRARLVIPRRKASIHLRVDPEVLDLSQCDCRITPQSAKTG
jgi:hypothetical protein